MTTTESDELAGRRGRDEVNVGGGMDGTSFGPYRLLEMLGRGGMGEVWRARDTDKDRDVAVKVLGSWLGAEPDYARRFRREAALAARLNSPNIVPIHDYGEIDGRLFIEMPLIEGVDLHALVTREGRLPASRTVGIIEQVADALDIAHEAGLVHRDVKPSNVLVTTRRGRDSVYLIDFGIARSVDSSSSSHTGAIIGTLPYMAPERFEGEGDHRSDVYALACVLHTVLTGRAPFVAPVAAFPLGFYYTAHRSQPPPRPSYLVADVPAGFDAVIVRGMAKAPAHRYPTAGDLGAAARAALTSGHSSMTHAEPAPPVPVTQPGDRSPPAPSGARDGSPEVAESSTLIPAATARDVPVAQTTESGRPLLRTPPAARRATRRLRRGRASIVVLVVLVSVITSIVIRATGTNPTSTFALVTERQLVGHTDWVSTVAVGQLNGRPVVISGSDDSTVRVWDLTTGKPVGSPFRGHAATVSAVATAQLDGRPVVVSGSDDKTVRVWDLATGQLVGAPSTRTVLGVSAVAVGQLNGRPVIVSGGRFDTVQTWDLSTGKPIAPPLGAPVYAIATAQVDGRSLVITGGEDYAVRVWDLATGEPVGPPLLGHTGTVHAVATAQLNGRPVAISGGDDSTVRVWDLATGKPVGPPLLGHTGTVDAVATAQLNGRPVAISGGDDSTVRVWDLATGKPVGPPLLGHTGTVDAVATAQVNGRLAVVSGSYDKTVRIWELEARTNA